MSSLARAHSSLAQQVVCVWENGVFKATRVNGFLDAVRQVWYAEGMKGLWKGAGTTLYDPSLFHFTSVLTLAAV